VYSLGLVLADIKIAGSTKDRREVDLKYTFFIAKIDYDFCSA